MVLWKQSDDVSNFTKFSEDLKECRDYIFDQRALHKPFKTYVGVPLITYTLKNGEMFKLPILEDWVDVYDYRIRSISFICNARASIFGHLDTADMCHLSGLRL